MFAVMEREILARTAALFGLAQADGSGFDGVMQAGGSFSNLSAFVVARNEMCPASRTHGVAGQRLVCFASAQAHYSIARAAMVCGLGLGEDVCVTVPASIQGCMDPEALDRALEKAKSEGKQPFFVNATAGTTVMGGFDDFQAIAAVCRKHKVLCGLVRRVETHSAMNTNFSCFCCC
eukprot:m.180697 g.180697  ORF g.180697 m.180697 type:complete len:177 (+) comp21469_c0_seq3:310-840(+)